MAQVLGLGLDGGSDKRFQLLSSLSGLIGRFVNEGSDQYLSFLINMSHGGVDRPGVMGSWA